MVSSQVLGEVRACAHKKRHPSTILHAVPSPNARQPSAPDYAPGCSGVSRGKPPYRAHSQTDCSGYVHCVLLLSADNVSKIASISRLPPRPSSPAGPTNDAESRGNSINLNKRKLFDINPVREKAIYRKHTLRLPSKGPSQPHPSPGSTQTGMIYVKFMIASG